MGQDNNLNMNNIDLLQGCNFEEFVGGDNKVFEIPLFQRNFSWEEEQCKQMFDDILDACNNNDVYYIGNFIFYQSSNTFMYNKLILIDGQQRITSLLLLLCAMRDSYDNLNMINTDFLTNNNSQEKYRFKLKQNYNDFDDFKEIMNGNIDENKKSNIYNAYNNFKTWLNDSVSKNKVVKLYETIKKLELIAIGLKSEDIERVQDIFEKMNSTGEPLKPADLIRNYLLFSKSTDTQKDLHEYWKIIEDIVGEKDISKFAKSFLILNTFEDVENDKVYSEFKKKFKNQNHEDILKNLVYYATFYSMIEKQIFYEIKNNDYKHPIKYDFDENDGTSKNNSLLKLKTTFCLLDKIGTNEINPFFFQLCDKLYYSDINKLNDICELILEFVIRYRIVQPSGGGGALSTKIRSIMSNISTGNCSLTLKSIYKELSNNDNSEASRYPDDAEFISALKGSVTIKNARVLLYQFARRKGEELLSFDSNTTVEHLMPQTPNNWWITNLGGEIKYGKTRQTYLNSIGNLALVSRKLNATMSNASWNVKRKELLDKALSKSTLSVAKLDNWNANTMKRRNNSLSNSISQIITGPLNEKKKSDNWLIK